MIKPYSKGIEPSTVDGKIAFTISENGAYVLEIDDYHGLLYIFHNKPRPCEDPSRVTHYFGRGVHVPGKIVLHSGESVYVDKDALVYGCIYAENAENIHIWGNGILDDSREERESENCTGSCVNGNLKFYDCKNLCIEGVGVVNSAIWCVNLFHCFDVLIDGINVFGQWRYNTDGIDIVNSARVTVRNSFVHSFDDTVVIKGIDKYAWESNRDILIEHCVLWCDWGRNLQIGVETWAKEYRNIIFKNCDIIHMATIALAVENGNNSNIHDVVFENINVELRDDSLPEVIQRSDNEHYPNENFVTEQTVICVDNHRFGIRVKNPDSIQRRTFTDAFGKVNNITFKSINVFSNKVVPKVRIVSDENAAEFENIVIESLSLGGKTENISKSFDFQTENAEVIIK